MGALAARAGVADVMIVGAARVTFGGARHGPDSFIE
jgi:hypothetical protein